MIDTSPSYASLPEERRQRVDELRKAFCNCTSPDEAKHIYQLIEKDCPGFWEDDATGPSGMHDALCSYAKTGRMAMIQFMVNDLKMEIDYALEVFERIPVHEAIRAGHEDIAWFLIKAGADIHREDYEGLTVVALAAHKAGLVSSSVWSWRSMST